LPDLVADTLEMSPAYPKEGDRVHFSAHIALFGPDPLSDVRWVAVTKDLGTGNAYQLASDTIRRIDPNTYWTVHAYWEAKQGDWEVWFHVDPDSKLQESNEDNNVVDRFFSVAKDFPSFFAPKVVSRFETAPGSAVFTLAFDHNGSMVASGTINPSEVRLFFRNGTLRWKYSVGGWAAMDIAISADGRFLVVGNGHDSLFLFSTNGTMLWKKPYRWVNSVAISADGSMIALSASEQRSSATGVTESVLMVLGRNGSELWWAAPARHMEGVSLTPNGNYVAVLGEDSFSPKDVGGRLFLYDRNGRMLWYRRLDDFDTYVGARLSAPAIAEDAKAIAVAGEDGRLRTFDRDGNLIWTRESGAAMGSFGDRVVVISSDGRCIAVGSNPQGGWRIGGSKVRLFSLHGVEQTSLEAPELSNSWRILGIGMSADGSYVAASPNSEVGPFFFLFRIPNAEQAVGFASRALNLGRGLGVNLSSLESGFTLAQNAFADGFLASSYDTALKFFSTVHPLLRLRLEEMLKETKDLTKLTDSRLHSFDKTTIEARLKHVDSSLQTVKQAVGTAETSMQESTLASYEIAFNNLRTAKEDLLNNLSELERVSSIQASERQNLQATIASIAIVIAVVLLLAVTVHRHQKKRQRIAPRK